MTSRAVASAENSRSTRVRAAAANLPAKPGSACRRRIAAASAAGSRGGTSSPRLLGGDGLVGAADGRGHHGPLGGHRLEYRDRQSLEQGRQHDEVRRRQQVGHVGAFAEEDAAAGHAQLTRLGLEVGAEGTVAGEDERRARAPRRPPATRYSWPFCGCSRAGVDDRRSQVAHRRATPETPDSRVRPRGGTLIALRTTASRSVGTWRSWMNRARTSSDTAMIRR